MIGGKKSETKVGLERGKKKVYGGRRKNRKGGKELMGGKAKERWKEK